MEPRVVKIDLLDYLFSNVGVFSQLDVAGKRKIFSSRPQPVFDVVLDYVNDKKYVTQFDAKYYTDYPWMTACPKRKVLFCFVCLLQGKTVESVICARNDVVAAALAHESTSSHMTCYDSCLRSVAAPLKEDPKRDFVLRKKKHLLGKLAQTLYLLKCKNYFEKLGTGREFSFKIINFMALNDISFSMDWENFFPQIVNDSKSETCIFSTLRTLIVEHIKNELAQVDFVSMQIEDVSEYIAKPTIGVTFRFIAENKIQERFGGFYELVDYGSKIDDETLVEILNYWEVGQKLIGISSDFGMDRVPILVPERPFVLFNVTSANHHMNYVIVKIASVHHEVREFLGKIQTLVTFFRDVVDDVFTKNSEETSIHLVPKDLTNRNNLIDQQISAVCSHLIDPNSDSIDISTWKNHPNNSLYLHQINEMAKLTKEPLFVFYGGLFKKLFKIGNNMTKVLVNNFCDDQVGKLNILTSVQSLAGAVLNSTDQKKTVKIISGVLKDFDLRDKNHSNFAIGKLFSMNQNREEVQDTAGLIKSTLDSVLTETKGLLDFNLARLRTELQNVFKDPNKHLPAGALFDHMVSTGSTVVYPEFTKLLKFFLTLPTSTIDEPQESTYRRIKSFAKVTRGVDDFDLDYLFIENDLTMRLLGDRDFLRYLINQIAQAQGMTDIVTESNIL